MDEFGKYLLAFSVNFDSDQHCEAFSFDDSYDNRPLKQMILISDIIQKLLHRRLKKSEKESKFLDFSEKPFYVGMLQYHSLYFVAIYQEAVIKFNQNQIDHIHASLTGIASSFFALFHSATETPVITDETTDSFLEAIPIILYQNTLKNVKNCKFCSIEKVCVPKILEQKIQ